MKGPTACFKCHKPLARTVWETKAAFHKDSISQLRSPKAQGFATAIGLASPMTARGPGDCVSCHATVIAGPPDVGVSCESCHGPAGRYLTPHQEPTFYDKPERLGLRDLYNKPQAIAQMCIDCHVTPDPRLKKAGHPAGESFDPGKGILKMVHWPSDISEKRKRGSYGPALYAQISQASAPLIAKRLAGGGGVQAVEAKPAPPAAGGAPTGGGAPAGGGVPAAVPRKAPGPADPFDWDQPVAPLPANYPGDSGSKPAPAPVANPPAPSTAVETPRIPEVAAVAPTPPAAPSVSLPPGAPRPATAKVADLRGRGAAILTELLKAKGAGQLAVGQPRPPQEFDGPDGELLRLQDEILYLALETLRKP